MISLLEPYRHFTTRREKVTSYYKKGKLFPFEKFFFLRSHKSTVRVIPPVTITFLHPEGLSALETLNCTKRNADQQETRGNVHVKRKSPDAASGQTDFAKGCLGVASSPRYNHRIELFYDKS